MIEHECPRCHRLVELPLGALCRDCRAQIEARAARLARWVSAASTALLLIWVLTRWPQEPQGRVVVTVGVAVWYLISHLVVRRAARELLP